MKFQFLSFFFVLSLFAFVSCGDDAVNDCNGFNIQTDLSDEIQATTDAAIVYGNDPTQQNCDAYKDAWQDYLDALRDLEDCARDAGALAEFNQAIQDAEDAVDQIC